MNSKTIKKIATALTLLGAVLLILSITGVMNQILPQTSEGRASELTKGNVQCSIDTTCPLPKCFGSFDTAAKAAVTVDSSEAAKQASNLGTAWYDFQGKLKEVRCVEGYCQTSPYCMFEYSDITKYATLPFEWIKQYPFVLVGLFTILALVVFIMTGKEKQ
jgi:hypothetical protein